jgi:hypothetical protein
MLTLSKNRAAQVREAFGRPLFDLM